MPTISPSPQGPMQPSIETNALLFMLEVALAICMWVEPQLASYLFHGWLSTLPRVAHKDVVLLKLEQTQILDHLFQTPWTSVVCILRMLPNAIHEKSATAAL